MSYENLTPGRNVPHDVNVIVEITKGEGRVKYEYDRKTGVIVVDRIRHSSLLYPINYGCIPQTLADDGDPIDVIVMGDEIHVGAVMSARPVAMLVMDDEKGHDVKILCVPSDSLTPHWSHIQKLADVPKADIDMLEHFFKHYKDLDSGSKWSHVIGWEDVGAAHNYIHEAIERAQGDKRKSA
jgi:inorganic pyrophosphatase